MEAVPHHGLAGLCMLLQDMIWLSLESFWEQIQVQKLKLLSHFSENQVKTKFLPNNFAKEENRSGGLEIYVRKWM